MFSIGDIVNESWAIIKKNIWIFAATLLGFFLLFFLAYYLIIGASIIALLASSNSDPSAVFEGLSVVFVSAGFIIGVFVLILAACVFYTGFIRMALDAADGKTPDLSAFSTITIKKVVNLFFGSLLFSIITGIGFLLCIVPGIILYTRLIFFVLFIIEKDCNAIEALSESWKSTKTQTMNLILLGLVFMLISFLGSLACGIGTFVTTPMIYIGFALTYRLLTGAKAADNTAFESLSDEDTPMV